MRRQVWTSIAVVLTATLGLLVVPTGSSAEEGARTGDMTAGIAAQATRPDVPMKQAYDGSHADSSAGGALAAASAEQVCIGDDIVLDRPGDLGADLLMVRTTGSCVSATSFEVYTRDTPHRIFIWIYVDDNPNNGCDGADQVLVYFNEIGAFQQFRVTNCTDNGFGFVDEYRAVRVENRRARGLAVSPGFPGRFAFDIGVFDSAGNADWMNIGLFNAPELITCDGLRIPGSPSDAADGYWLSEFAGTVWSAGNATEAGGACRSEGAYSDGGVADIAAVGDGWAAVHYDGLVSYADNISATGATIPPLPPLVGAGYAISIMNDPDGPDGALRVVYDNGVVVAIDGASHHGDLSGVPLNLPMIDAVPTVTGQGYWLIAEDGGVFAFGDAEFYGSMGGVPLNEPVLGMAPDPDGVGYWLVAGDGGVFAFGADFAGSMGGSILNRPMIGMVPYGDAYMMVASDGGVFNFSNRAFVGSLGATPPPTPITSILPTS